MDDHKSASGQLQNNTVNAASSFTINGVINNLNELNDFLSLTYISKYVLIKISWCLNKIK